jgi:hypothetical protein
MSAHTIFVLARALTRIRRALRRMGERRPTTVAKGGCIQMKGKFLLTLAAVSALAMTVVSSALAVTVPAVPVDAYGDSLLSSLASAIAQILPYAAAITAFAIGVGMLKRWLGHRKATRV